MRKGLKLISLLTALLLCLAPAALAQSVYSPIDVTEKQLAAANLFLSNFTEVGVDHIESWYEDIDLVDFAHDHMWFNDCDAFEYGEYFGDNNCRVSDGDIQRLVDKYFYDAPDVDLSQTRFDYKDGYYYHCETGGWISCGFAHTVSICPLGDDAYFISFMIFGGGYAWDNSVLDDELADIEAEYGHPCGYGSALVHAEDLSDRNTYQLISYSALR